MPLTFAPDGDRNDSSLSATFLHNLSDDIKDQLRPLDLPVNFDDLVALVIKTDNRLFERRREKARSAKSPPLHWRQPFPSLQFSVSLIMSPICCV